MKNFLADIRGKTNEGFTLVELMVVVAIIGILSAVAIPNFKRYQAKTKTSEAKLQLSAVYSSLISLQSDYDAYATCLEDAGYSPSTAANYYAVGFAVDNSTARGIVTGNGGVCRVADTTSNPKFSNQYQFPANKSVGGYTAPATDLAQINLSSLPNPTLQNPSGFSNPTVDNTGTWFIAGAIGGIDSKNNTNAKASKWVINENKALIQVNRGY